MQVLRREIIPHEQTTTATSSLLLDRALVRHVDTVQELTDILVPYAADALDGCGWEGVLGGVRVVMFGITRGR